MRITTIKCDKCAAELKESDVKLLRMQDGAELRKNYELCEKCMSDIQRIINSNESFVQYRLKKAAQIIKNWEQKVGNDRAIEVIGCSVGHITDMLEAIAKDAQK